jgi:hypothetical protein
LAKQAGFADRISFQEGRAEAIPLADGSVDVALSFMVMEEGDADRMLAELVRVTRAGGRIAAIVRSLDMPPWTNAALSPAVRAKVDAPGRGDVGRPVARTRAFMYGLTPTAQWWGVAIKKVPSASARATAVSHSALCSSVRLPRILCFITAMREAWDASTDANCEKQVNPTRLARRNPRPTADFEHHLARLDPYAV